MMTKSGRAMLRLLPPRVNRDGKIIRAIVANEEGTGALEKMLEYGDQVMREYAKTPNVYEQSDAVLDKSVSFFSFLERFYEESDEALKKRLRAIMYRKGDQKFGSVWNAIHVFEDYFGTRCRIVDNSVPFDDESNLIRYADFEDEKAPLVWNFENGASIKISCGIEGIYGAEVPSGGKASQTVTGEFSDGYYFVNYFAKGSTRTRVYVDGDVTGLSLLGNEGQSESIDFLRGGDDWGNNLCYFRIEGTAESIRIEIEGIEEAYDACIDLITLNKKPFYNLFTLYVIFDGISIDAKTFSLGENTEDIETPIPERYKHESYMDNSYMVGASANSFSFDVYEEVLSYVKACGVKGYIRILVKEA